MLPPTFRLTVTARLEADRLLGGEPFSLIRLTPEAATRLRAWRDGEPVGDAGAFARACVMHNLAQPLPPPGPPQPVTAVIPVRDRDITRLLEALDVAETIVVDDASDDGEPIRAVAESAGARYIRRETRGGAAAARNAGLDAASHELVALIDSDCVPRPGWLEPLVAHFADPELSAVAPRIVALEAAPRGGPPGGGASPRGGAAWARRSLARYEARRSPLDRGPDPGRVVPHGRVPFVPGAALVVRRHLRFDETLTSGGEDVDLAWRAPYVRYEPRSHVAHAHRTTARAWLARRVYYGRTAAALDRRHPGNARPLHVSPWTTAAWAALAARRPTTALAITAVATALLTKDLPPKPAAEIAALGTLRSGRVVADALTRAWWPLSALAALTIPRTRAPLAAAVLAKSPLQLADDLAYGLGLWQGCIAEHHFQALLPARGWRVRRVLGSISL